jgi:hypothetical protein
MIFQICNGVIHTDKYIIYKFFEQYLNTVLPPTKLTFTKKNWLYLNGIDKNTAIMVYSMHLSGVFSRSINEIIQTATNSSPIINIHYVHIQLLTTGICCLLRLVKSQNYSL